MPSELGAAVCRVMSAVRYVPETGKNKFHGYTYASDEDLLSVLQPAMADNGLSLIPSGVMIATVEHTPDGKGKPQWRTDLVVTYTLLHSGGESQIVQSPGCGIDGEDKGTYKAMTGALKYALRHLFLVPTGQDAERAEEPKRTSAKNRAADTEPTAEHRQQAERVKADREAAEAARKAKHHESWDQEKDGVNFTRAVTGKLGLNMDVVSILGERTEPWFRRPTAMTKVERIDYYRWLDSDAGRLAYDALVVEREMVRETA